MNRNIVVTVLSRSMMLVAGFAASVITARLLGPGGRGDFFFVTTLAATIVQFANLGLHSSNTYFVSGDRELLGRLLTNTAWVSLAVGLAAAGGVVLALRFARVIPNAPNQYLWYAVILAPPLLFFMLGANLLVGIGRIGTFNVIEAGARLLVVAAFAAVAVAGATVGRFLAANAVAWALGCAAIVIALLPKASAPLWFDRGVFAQGFHYAAKAYLAALLGFLVLRANVFLLERMTTSSGVGYFSVASQVADALAIVPNSVALVLFPDLVRRKSDRWRMTIRSCIVSVAALTVICVVVGLAAGPLVRLVFGAGFEPSVRILRWMLPGVVALGAISIVSQYLAAIGFPRSLLGAWAVALGFVLVLGFFLIRSHGASGAAVALSATYCGLFVLILGLAARFHRRTRDTGETDRSRAPLDIEPEPPWV